MSRTVSLADAKSRFSDVVRRAESGEPVVLTRYGKPVVALVPASEVELLQRLRAAGPELGLASLAGGWKGSDELVRRVRERKRRGVRSRVSLD